MASEMVREAAANFHGSWVYHLVRQYDACPRANIAGHDAQVQGFVTDVEGMDTGQVATVRASATA